MANTDVLSSNLSLFPVTHRKGHLRWCVRAVTIPARSSPLAGEVPC